MDSRLRAIALTSSVAVIILSVIAVLYANGMLGHGRAQNAPVETKEPSQTDESVYYETGQVGDDLSGFLQDAAFFDEDENKILSGAKDLSNRLSILTTSVEKDLRVQVVGAEGKPVTGESFWIRLTDSKGKSAEYKDLDQDGVIYAGALDPGNYQVQLLPQEGYKVPSNSISVRVKERVEYVAIEDISLLLLTEADIDPIKEDTQINSARKDADDTEIVKLQPGSTRTKSGIDVSKYQKDIDWEKVAASGVSFVIIRAGYRGSATGALVEDPYFKKNIKGASDAGLQVGVYFFTQAISEAEAVEEASAVLSLVNEYKLQLPVYIDTEGAGGNGRADKLDKDTRTLVCEAFCRTVKNAGLEAGVYASRNWLKNNLDTSKLEKFETWLAEYRETPLYQGYYTMWQYTSKGSVDGI